MIQPILSDAAEVDSFVRICELVLVRTVCDPIIHATVAVAAPNELKAVKAAVPPSCVAWSEMSNDEKIA